MNKGENCKKVLANVTWMLFDKVFLLLLNLVVTIRVANHYGTSGYGNYQYAVNMVAIFEILVAFIDSRVVKKKYGSEDAKEVVWNTTVAKLFLSIIVMLLGAGYVLFLTTGDLDYKAVFMILLSNCVIINLRFGMQNRYEYILQTRKVVIASNVALGIGGCLQLVAVSLQFPIVMIAVITILASILSLTIVYAQYRKDFGRLFQGKYNKTLIKSLVLESSPLAIAASCSIIYSKCDSLMVGDLMSKDEVGIYDIAVKLIAVVQIAIAPIRESVYPKMIELYKKERERYVARYIQITSILTWVYIFGVAFSFLILPFFFKLFRPEYAPAYSIYRIYVIGSFFAYNAGLRAGHYTLINRGSILMYTQMFSVVLNLLLNYYLINRMGAYGAALATVITQGLSLFFSNLLFGKDGREVFMWQVRGLNPLKMIS